MRRSTAVSREKEKSVPVVGYPDRYLVSNAGRVWSVRTDKFLKPVRHSRGYVTVNLYDGEKSRPLLIHRLVAAASLGPCPPGYEVSHANAKKDDNRIVNIAYTTRAENRRHAVFLGLTGGARPKGNKMGRHWTAGMRRLRDLGWSERALAREFRVSRHGVRKALGAPSCSGPARGRPGPRWSRPRRRASAAGARAGH
jgi:hypothetical protein